MHLAINTKHVNLKSTKIVIGYFTKILWLSETEAQHHYNGITSFSRSTAHSGQFCNFYHSRSRCLFCFNVEL